MSQDNATGNAPSAAERHRPLCVMYRKAVAERKKKRDADVYDYIRDNQRRCRYAMTQNTKGVGV